MRSRESKCAADPLPPGSRDARGFVDVSVQRQQRLSGFYETAHRDTSDMHIELHMFEFLSVQCRPIQAGIIGRRVEKENRRISLGLKQLQPDPWTRVADHYHPGDRLQGRVVSITDYGVFVEVEPGIEGLIHVSEMSWSKRAKHPSKIVKKDDQVEVAVLEVKPTERRLSLSLRETLPDPWDSFAERFPIGTEVEGAASPYAPLGAPRISYASPPYSGGLALKLALPIRSSRRSVLMWGRS